MMKTIQLRKFATRYYPASDEVEIVFGEGAEAIGVKMHRANAGRFLAAVGQQVSAMKPPGDASIENVMTMRTLGASEMPDGTPVLRIATTNLPELAFAISPDQLEAVEAWLSKARQTIQGRKSH